MDFFEHQDKARRHTTVMVGLFVLAVVAIVAILNLVGVFLYAWLSEMPADRLLNVFRHTPRWVYGATTGVTLAIIAFGTLTRLYELSAGGAAVAKMVGARVVRRDSRDPLERRLLNIVDEMALASGISAPVAYVMDEQESINAFAAGYSPNEAVVAVTRGTLERLNRDELQGVVGHEFSHILNGDMRLNIRLIGVISGIVMIGSLGRFLMDAGSGRGRKDGDARVWILGLVIWIIGSIGVFFGSLIKAAVSRQREFLADASSVQFTRNPDGICGALFKIGEVGGVIEQQGASELSHMCISIPVSSFSSTDFLATHPPLEARITRVMGPGAVHLLRDRVKREDLSAAPDLQAAGGSGMEGAAGLVSGLAGSAPSSVEWGKAPTDAVHTTAKAVVDSVGAPSEGHVDAARRILSMIPGEVREGARTPEGAMALICALLLGEGDIRAIQLASIRAQAGEAVAGLAEHFDAALKGTDPRLRMPLLDLAMPVLKVMEAPARQTLLALAKVLIEADRKMTLGEFVLLTICSRHLAHEPKGPPPIKHKGLDTLAAESALVISLLAHAGRAGQPAFDKGMRALALPGTLRPTTELGFAAVEKALYELKLLAPLKKPIFIKGCLETVMADGKLTVVEGELMRALCATLDSPLPPLLDTAEISV
jgi:Zn-dependent protease with chaperone function